jgi:hypothetical protein
MAQGEAWKVLARKRLLDAESTDFVKSLKRFDLLRLLLFG